MVVETLKAFVQRNDSWMRNTTFTWGTAGYVLCAARDYRGTTEWMADWRERSDAEPWMLVNAVEGFQATGREREAAEVTQFGLTLPPGYGQHLMEMWKGIDAA